MIVQEIEVQRPDGTCGVIAVRFWPEGETLKAFANVDVHALMAIITRSEQNPIARVACVTCSGVVVFQGEFLNLLDACGESAKAMTRALAIRL
jgi:hypothetical protein